jgi:hypothetical protein
MFSNLTFKHDAEFFYDVLSFDLSCTLMERLWAIFGEQRQKMARLGPLEHRSMWDGEEGIFLAIDAIGGAISFSAYDGRICVKLDPELDPADPTTPLAFEHNWVRFAPILRWLREITA